MSYRRGRRARALSEEAFEEVLRIYHSLYVVGGARLRKMDESSYLGCGAITEACAALSEHRVLVSRRSRPGPCLACGQPCRRRHSHPLRLIGANCRLTGKSAFRDKMTERHHLIVQEILPPLHQILVSVFVDSKLFVASALGIDKLLPAVSLDITFGTLAAAVLVSLWTTRKDIPA